MVNMFGNNYDYGSYFGVDVDEALQHKPGLTILASDQIESLVQVQVERYKAKWPYYFFKE